jgi:glycosyltransferase involved in cell wall biosynthesis
VGDRIKVVITSKDLDGDGGVVNFVRMLLSRLEVDVCATHLRVGERRRGEGSFIKVMRAIGDNGKLLRMVRRNGIQCLHVNPSMRWTPLARDGLLLVVGHAAGVRGRIVFFHGWDQVVWQRIRKSRILRALFQVVFSQATYIVVLGRCFRQELVDAGFPAERVVVLSTMFDGALFSNQAPKILERPPTVLFMSRLVVEKGVYELVEAFRTVRRAIPGARLVIAGDGPERAGLARAVNSHGLTEAVEFPGYIRGKRKAEVLRDADIFVLPTYGEGLPVALLEAMASGVAVAATATGGITDVLVDGEHGLLLPEVSADAVAQAVCRLLADKEMRSAMGQRNRELAWSRFEADVVTGALERIYVEAVGGAPR